MSKGLDFMSQTLDSSPKTSSRRAIRVWGLPTIRSRLSVCGGWVRIAGMDDQQDTQYRRSQRRRKNDSYRPGYGRQEQLDRQSQRRWERNDITFEQRCDNIPFEKVRNAEEQQCENSLGRTYRESEQCRRHHRDHRPQIGYERQQRGNETQCPGEGDMKRPKANGNENPYGEHGDGFSEKPRSQQLRCAG